jgi:hypothetical protein
MSFEKPKKVREAQLSGDTEALSSMGKKGAKKAAETRAILADMRAEYKEQVSADATLAELIYEHGEERAKEIFKELE